MIVLKLAFVAFVVWLGALALGAVLVAVQGAWDWVRR